MLYVDKANVSLEVVPQAISKLCSSLNHDQCMIKFQGLYLQYNMNVGPIYTAYDRQIGHIQV